MVYFTAYESKLQQPQSMLAIHLSPSQIGSQELTSVISLIITFPQSFPAWLDCSWPCMVSCKTASVFSWWCLFLSACFTGWSMRMRWNNGGTRQRSSGKVTVMRLTSLRTCITYCLSQWMCFSYIFTGFFMCTFTFNRMRTTFRSLVPL